VDLTVLKKKISSYRTPAGQIRNLPNELLAEILHAWEQWTGSAKSFYQELETNQKKLAGIIGKAKKLKREGAFDGLNFTEVIIEGENEASNSACSPSTGCNIELVYQNNVIRFGSPDLLLDFLKKAA
jgi:hypothetical protein